MSLGQLWTFLGVALPVLAALLVPMPSIARAYQLRAGGCARRPATVLTLLSFVVAAPALALRPQLFAIVLFAATMWILAKRREHPRRLWLIPLIAIAWANLHGSFPLVVVLVALGWLDELLRARDAATERPTAEDRLMGSTGLALIGAIAAVATLVTPFGVDTWRYVVSLASNPDVSGRVSEWRPPWPLDPTGLLFYLSVVAVLVVVWLRLRADRFRVPRATVAPYLTLLVFGVLGAITGRGLAWWALVAPVAAANLAHEGALTSALPRALEPLRILFRDTPPGRSTRTNRLNSIVAGVLLLAGIALLPLWRPAGAMGVPAATLTDAPEGIAVELRRAVAAGEIRAGAPTWNPQAWGSWLEWAVPDLAYTVDSRIELFPATLWDDVDQVASMRDDWLAVLDTRRVEVVIVTSDDGGLDGELQEAGWQLAFRDDDGAILLPPPRGLPR